jgi:hypothetical protein
VGRWIGGGGGVSVTFMVHFRDRLLLLLHGASPSTTSHCSALWLPLAVPLAYDQPVGTLRLGGAGSCDSNAKSPLNAVALMAVPPRGCSVSLSLPLFPLPNEKLPF